MTDKTEAMDNLIAQDADLIDVASKVTEADREVLIRISNSDDETASRIHRGLIYTWEVGELARHRQYGYDQGYYDGCTRQLTQSDTLGFEIREMNPPDNGQYYTVKELVDGTSGPVRSALLTMESRILALEHDLAEERAALKRIASGWPKPMQLARETLEKKK
jgi:hypothetical protein